MVLYRGVSEHVTLSAALYNVPFSGAFRVLNTPLSGDSRILFQYYYLDH